MAEDDWAALEARPLTGKRGNRVDFKVVEALEVSFLFDVSRSTRDIYVAKKLLLVDS